ncbi:hypothetical protein [Caldalkalibacillus thermarum]|uniref:hypothetical protein n=1 Tax=Caldalkalibacillus thermarum TaxID=296745 RepID=UPI00166D847A|nr:hypothetical protein [Caldalkalibacillus thermarum]
MFVIVSVFMFETEVHASPAYHEEEWSQTVWTGTVFVPVNGIYTYTEYYEPVSYPVVRFGPQESFIGYNGFVLPQLSAAAVQYFIGGEEVDVVYFTEGENYTHPDWAWDFTRRSTNPYNLTFYDEAITWNTHIVLYSTIYSPDYVQMQVGFLYRWQ